MKLGTIAEGVQTPLAAKLTSLRPAMAAAAQQVYDSWQPDPIEGDPELGDGGICDQIAMEISTVMSAEGIDITEGGHEGDDHAYIVAYDENESFAVNIDPRHYESGGGYSWIKSPDVIFSPEMVSISEVQRPDWIEDEYGGLEDADEFSEPTACSWCGGPLDDPNSEDCRSCSQYLSSPEYLGESSEYAGLEDADEFEEEPMDAPVTESLYAGLEDADEFKQPSDDCMYCGAEFNPHAGGFRQGSFIHECQSCNNKTCEQCMDANGWDYDYAIDTGSTATCPECLIAYNIP